MKKKKKNQCTIELLELGLFIIEFENTIVIV